MFWFIVSVLLGTIAAVSLIYNVVKDTKIDALEYEVAYLVKMLFEDKSPKRELSDDEVREIKDKWDKLIK
ncbi:hypothetical protein BU110_00625 [Staphylococcus shinii]|uniref:hypothetical protein n=1 Tax=Staphylococcus shinii TaxID=2912228 RepID=UPI000D1EFC25|nr:hypothetical protein [Staphylococcus shinii]PTI68091.1 hypothetical protein BU110_00625 [Staphylococcus shinii]